MISISLSAQNFEVVSIKPNSQKQFGPNIRFTLTCEKGRFVARNDAVKQLISWAYGVGRDEVMNAPNWTETAEETYDIDATLPAGTTQDECRIMLKNALTDRFHLQTHAETKRSISDYSLSVDKSGIKLREPDVHGPANLTSKSFGLGARSASMHLLAAFLSQKLGGIVKNETHLEGLVFDFDLNWVPADPADPESLNSAIIESVQRLGLRLLKKRSVDLIPTVFVDRIEKPSPN